MGKISLSLRLRHSTLDVGKISRQFGLNPSREWRAGDPNVSPTGRPLGGFSPSSYSTASIDIAAASGLADALANSVARLELHKVELAEFLHAGGSAAIFIGWFLDRNEGEILEATLLGRLSQLGVSLEFDVYPPDP